MDELYTLVFGICGALLAVEVISHLFPEKSGEMIRGIAVISVLAVLLAGVLETDFNFDFELTNGTVTETETLDDLALESGIALLRERLYALLQAAGIDDSGEITIDRVCVCIRYGTDADRVFALLRSVLTEAIPVEIYTQ